MYEEELGKVHLQRRETCGMTWIAFDMVSISSIRRSCSHNSIGCLTKFFFYSPDHPDRHRGEVNTKGEF